MSRLALLWSLAACSLYDRSAPPLAALPDARVQTSGSPEDTVTTLDGSGLDTCILGDVATPLRCVVSDVLGMGTANETDTLLPPCTTGVVFPCWYSADDANCLPSGLALVVVRETSAPIGTEVIAFCAL